MRTRVTGLYLEKMAGKQGLAYGEEQLWRSRSRHHDHRFLWFLLHLKDRNVVLRAGPLTQKFNIPPKVRADSTRPRLICVLSDRILVEWRHRAGDTGGVLTRA